MRRIYTDDGGSFVWQWQSKERICLEGYTPGVTVHYANRNTTEAPVVQTRIEGDRLVADVPPELLQEALDITVYICDENGTQHCHFLSVLSRPKPETYVYEPCEVLRYETLQKRIPFDASYDGLLLYVVAGVAMPLKLGPGLGIRDGVLYVSGGADKPDAEIPVTLDEDGTILVAADVRLDNDGTILISVPGTTGEDGSINIGGVNNA